jgi:prolipoprotein diacylglyceryltransferase
LIVPALYTQIGPWRLHTFTLALGVVIVLSLIIAVRRSQPRGLAIDACLGALLGGVIVARLFHVLLHWDYFVDNLPEARNIGAGGLDWHGAVLGGLLGLGIVTSYQLSVTSIKRGADANANYNANASTPHPLKVNSTLSLISASLRLKFFISSLRLCVASLLWDGGSNILSPPPYVSLRFTVLLDSLTFALPLIGLGAWYGCLAAGCGYGREVDTLANYPAWAASEYVDVFGIVAPRFNTPYFGMALCGIGLALAGFSGLWRRRRMRQSSAPTLPALRPPGRFWLLLALLSGGMFVIGFFRGDRALYWYGLRADQLLDLIMLLWGLSVVGYQGSGSRFLKNRRVIHEQAA